MKVSKITLQTKPDFLTGQNASIVMPTKENMSLQNFAVVKAQSMRKLFKFQQLQTNGNSGLTQIKNFETTSENITTVALWPR